MRAIGRKPLAVRISSMTRDSDGGVFDHRRDSGRRSGSVSQSFAVAMADEEMNTQQQYAKVEKLSCSYT